MRTKGRRREGEKQEKTGRKPIFDSAPICRGAVANLGQGAKPNNYMLYLCAGLRSEVRMPTRQPSSGRELVRKRVKRTWLLRTKLPKIVHLYHPLLRVCSHIFPIILMLDSGKLFEFACPMHWWTSNRSSSRRLPADPSFIRDIHDVASPFLTLRLYAMVRQPI